ncbi:MAG: saccharopine dehydrogenase NADP-binding domain-containing protein [Saprospiraceae bacterium]|nr:saccharopine dehydrogenase NADP-binding domain-containing protein [Saprospiraceae bacterium]MDW8484364.1 saccharopine dehydrogenase C-terminal domain-containing protein [Saprospiraceae bacterium]
MKKILVLGAGRSATALIDYLLQHASEDDYGVIVADAQPDLAHQKVGGHWRGQGVGLDVADVPRRRALIEACDVVVSLLPPTLHVEVARDCLSLNRHLVTASYISEELRALDGEARARGLVFMNELGLDPGLDHMSAIQRIRHIQQRGGRIVAFYSATGGLVAPESDDNPWHYKFSWNPRNVVLAGQGMAQYLEDGRLKLVPYHRLFSQYRLIHVPGLGAWEVYANRDSLKYREIYGLQQAKTLFRGTIRHRGFCDAWHAIVQLGLTEANFTIPNSKEMTYAGLVEALLGQNASEGGLRKAVARLLNLELEGPVMRQLEWLGLFEERPIGIESASPALALEQLLLEKWAMHPHDRDMIIMQHLFEYDFQGQHRRLTATLVAKGDDRTHTAMARLVGWPAGIFARKLLLGAAAPPGVSTPTHPEVYEPLLRELERMGVRFTEEEEICSQ